MAKRKTSDYKPKKTLLNTDIQNKTFRPAYLICGEEAYLRKQDKEKLIAAITDGVSEMNVTTFRGSDVREEEIVDLAETMPFFSDYRVIIVEDAGFFKSGGSVIANYLKAPAETVRFVFVEEHTSAANPAYKAVANTGLVLTCDAPEEKDLLQWIGVKCKQGGKRITNEAVRYLVTNVGSDMFMLENEITKLVNYTGEREDITIDDAKEVLAMWLNGRIFAMTDAIAEKDVKGALQYYYDLLALKERPLRILNMITEMFNGMLIAYEMDSYRYPQSEIAAAIGLTQNRAFLAARYAKWAQKYQTKRLKEIVAKCIEADAAVKSGRLSDKVSVEMLIIEATS